MKSPDASGANANLTEMEVTVLPSAELPYVMQQPHLSYKSSSSYFTKTLLICH